MILRNAMIGGEMLSQMRETNLKTEIKKIFGIEENLMIEI